MKIRNRSIHPMLLTAVMCAALVWTARAAAAAPPAVRLASGGRALQRIVTGGSATPRVKKAAGDLAEYLGRITGARFEVGAGDGRSGIAVGTPSQLPALGLGGLWDAKDPTRNEDYLLRSHAGGVYLVGATDLAVENAVWDFLYRLGYRQFFPGPTWEVVPDNPQPQIAVDTQQHPAYNARRIWYGFGPWDYNAQPYAEWCARNRAVSGIALNTGHAYDAIMSRNQAAFNAHPEYLGLIGGKRQSSKFCISNPGLRKLVVEDGLRQLDRTPSLQSISVEPSDGGNWCECDQCTKLGSITDRAVLLANDVADAVRQRHPGVFVSIYAYHQHSPPPRIRVHPGVVVSIATSFISGGYTVDQLVQGWARQGATIGIREYYSIHPWDHDLPGQARAGDTAYLRTTIPHFHEMGARFMSAESGDNWGPNGLGYYLASRMLWDPAEGGRVDLLREDFLQKAFGSARPSMTTFYRLIDGANKPQVTSDLVGRMYRALADAQAQTTDPKVKARINDLVLYTRYVELWQSYTSASGPQRLRAFENVVRHAYRIRKTMMVWTKALWRDVPRRDRALNIPAAATWDVPEASNPWKRDPPYSAAEAQAFLTGGIQQNKLLTFSPATFGRNLVPASRLPLREGPLGSPGLYSRGTRTYYTWLSAREPLVLRVKAGLVYTNKGTAKLYLSPGAPGQGPEDSAEVPPDKTEHEVVLRPSTSGLHRLEISDSAAGTSVLWPAGTPMTVEASANPASTPGAGATFGGRWSLYFYVPRGTRTVGGYADGQGTLLDANGNVVHTFLGTGESFSVAVPPGQDGGLWKFQNSTGQRTLLTVPPYMARSGRELLLPKEVVDKDGGR
jgi:hypothetical protein